MTATAKYLLGTDDQGRDVLSTIIYGMQHFAVGRLRQRAARHRDRRAARACRGLFRRHGRRGHHARRRRAADVSGYPDRRCSSTASRAASRGRRLTTTSCFRAGHLDRPELLGAIRAHGARLGVGRSQQGIRAGGAAHRLAAGGHHVPPHPAQRAGAGAGHRHHQPGARHHHRSDLVLPRRRRAADATVARHADPHRQRLSFSPASGGSRFFPASRSPSSCSRSTCSATGCATR